MVGFLLTKREKHPSANSHARTYLLSSTSGLLMSDPAWLAKLPVLLVLPCSSAQIAFTNDAISSFSGYSANIVLYEHVFQSSQLHWSDFSCSKKLVQGFAAALMVKLELQGAVRQTTYFTHVSLLEHSFFATWALYFSRVGPTVTNAICARPSSLLGLGKAPLTSGSWEKMRISY